MPTRVQDKIDVHHHIYPPALASPLVRNGGDPSGWFVPPWTLSADHQICSNMGVRTAILFCTAAGPDIEPNAKDARTLARACNDFNASIRDAEPQKYGFFASRYLGNAAFTPVWDFLSARHAAVFIHPTRPVHDAWINATLSRPSFNYPHEAGQTAIDLITSNMLRDHVAHCKIVLSHAGGTLAYLIDRVVGVMPSATALFKSGKSGEEMLDEARWFYHDTALSSSAISLRPLMALFGEENKGHVLFGERAG